MAQASEVATGLVILDCDGVLVDSERIAARVTCRALVGAGWVVDEQEMLSRFIGCSEDYFAAEVGQQLGARLPPAWFTRLDALVDEAFDRELVAVPGVVGALAELVAAGIATCVASNGAHNKIQGSLRRVGLYERFAGCIFSAADVRRGKPAPDLFLYAAERMGVVPSRCVVVEDSPRGVEAALRAGMRVLAYAGHTDPMLLQRPGVRVFDAMTDLAGLVADAGVRPAEPR